MKKRILQFGMTAKTVMIGLLIIIGIGNTIGQTFSVGNLNYSVNDDGISVSVKGHVNGTSATGNLVIPEVVSYEGVDYSVTSIGDLAFMNCSGLTSSLLIPNSVTTIGSGAFAHSGISGNLIIPNSVTTIGSSAFYDCNRINSVVLSNSMTSVGNYVFSECYNMTSVIIPSSVTSIGTNAFSYCISLASISIPNTVISIEQYAFHNTAWYNNHPEGILYLGDFCLGYKGSKPTGILNLREGTILIADFAFQSCSGLTGDLIIPNTTKSIGNYAFEGCSGITGTLSIPNSVISIGESAFGGCSGMSGNLTIPNSVTFIGYSAFSSCSGFTGSLIIGNSVTSIGSYAFDYCTGLNSVTIPNSVTFIGNSAFYCCFGLTLIHIFAETPPVLNSQVFIGVPKAIPVYVPYGAKSTYISTSGWSNFTNYHELVYATVSGYNESEGNWHFIASPLVENTTPTTVENMITGTSYDLYRFDQTENAEWQNYKANSFNLTNGQGYLYANAEDVNIVFKGNFNEDDTKEVSLAYDANAEFAGWNLVGNPFPINAYANRSYYVMNEEGTAIEPVAVSMEAAIPTCTGVMVKAENTGETVTFSKTASRGQEDQGALQIAVAQANTRGTAIMDKAIVSFNAGDKLEKYVFNKDNAQLYIPRGTNNYAIVCAEKTGEMPLNFEAKKNGTYTITVDTELADVDYLHLIDNLTGDDVDLLVEPAYTFEAKATDYASRFRLVFSVGGDAESDDEAFAYYADGEIHLVVETVHAPSLQIVDVMGRIVRCTDDVHTVSTSGMVPGVYVLRLIDGDVVKTQKIVIE